MDRQLETERFLEKFNINSRVQLPQLIDDGI